MSAVRFPRTLVAGWFVRPLNRYTALVLMGPEAILLLLLERVLSAEYLAFLGQL